MLIQYVAEDPQTVWGMYFEEGDFIKIDGSPEALDNLGQPEDHRIGSDGPWGWGGFTNEQIEEIADRIYCAGDDTLLWWDSGCHPDSLG